MHAVTPKPKAQKSYDLFPDEFFFAPSNVKKSRSFNFGIIRKLLLLVLLLSISCSQGKKEKTVFLTIIVQDAGHVLPKYLKCIDLLDYNKKLITIYINFKKSIDDTRALLEEWIKKNKDSYCFILFEESKDESISEIRNKSLQLAKAQKSDYYFMSESFSFFAPFTLKTLMSKKKPIISPMLLAIPELNDTFSNFYCDTVEGGYYKDHPDYWRILNKEKMGTFKVPVVHCTYLIDSKYFEKLTFVDGSNDYDFIIFSRAAQKNKVDQYICNEKDFGVMIHFKEPLNFFEQVNRMQYVLDMPFVFQENQTPENQKEDGKTIFLSILARNKAHYLPRYLKCLENQDYNKKLITVYINTNNNQDETSEILEEWIEKNRSNYREIVYENHVVNDMTDTCPHDWDPTRFSILGRIRNRSLQLCKKYGCDYYFVCDCDNMIIPSTLKTLVEKDKPIIAPLLYDIPEKNDFFTTYWTDVREDGWFKEHPDFWNVFFHRKIGTFKVALVHCTYLVKAQYLDLLTYQDGTPNWEFFIFAASARKNNVEQYICNEKRFGVQFAFNDKKLNVEDEKRCVRAFMAMP